MSRAFTKESDERDWLGDVAPDVSALEQFLTRESGEKVIESGVANQNGRQIHQMSNGKSYALDFDGRWEVVS